MPMAEANSLLIRCENSRSSSPAVEEYCSADGLSVTCIMLHPIGDCLQSVELFVTIASDGRN